MRHSLIFERRYCLRNTETQKNVQCNNLGLLAERADDYKVWTSLSNLSHDLKGAAAVITMTQQTLFVFVENCTHEKSRRRNADQAIAKI